MRRLRTLSAGAICPIVVGGLLLPAFAQGEEPLGEASYPIGEVTIHEDLVYATGDWPVGDAEWKLDLYLPPGGGDTTLVVHGPGASEGRPCGACRGSLPRGA